MCSRLKSLDDRIILCVLTYTFYGFQNSKLNLRTFGTSKTFVKIKMSHSRQGLPFFFLFLFAMPTQYTFSLKLGSLTYEHCRCFSCLLWKKHSIPNSVLFYITPAEQKPELSIKSSHVLIQYYIHRISL